MSADQLSSTFAALADPTRRAILARLVAGECSGTELAEPVHMSPAPFPHAPHGAARARPILARRGGGECWGTELAEPFDMSLPAVSKHLQVLERAGLIARGREAQWRPCRLEAGPLKQVADFVERYRH